ncbi:MAG: hypothetical protein DLM68_13355 [Hyphomicrobiales bacterium]|nr:MAG: hypothetical protein DLM68_13355 [Hyphomicrobiales bacterium]
MIEDLIAIVAQLYLFGNTVPVFRAQSPFNNIDCWIKVAAAARQSASGCQRTNAVRGQPRPSATRFCDRRTTFAPNLVSFSFRLVIGQSLIGSGVANVRRKLPRL